MTISLSTPVALIAPASPKHTTTPKKQLERLVGQQYESISLKIQSGSSLCQDAARIVAEYALEPRLTSWYTALEKIDRLPEEIPALSEADIAFLNSPCPKQICDKRKPNGELYSIIEKCALILIPETLVNLKDLEDVVKPYGEKLYSKDKNPLRLRDVGGGKIDSDYLTTPFGPTHWELHTNVLAATRRQRLRDQVDLIRDLARETGRDWQVQELSGTVAAIFFMQIGIGETLYSMNKNNDGYNNSTRVRGVGVFSLCTLDVAASLDGVSIRPSANFSKSGLGACLKL